MKKVPANLTIENWEIALTILQYLYCIIRAVCHIIQVILEIQKQNRQDTAEDK